MSTRTAIEINHDFFNAMQADRDAFAARLMAAIFHNEQGSWDALLGKYGIRKVYQRHHGDDPICAHIAQSTTPLSRKAVKAYLDEAWRAELAKKLAEAISNAKEGEHCVFMIAPPKGMS